MPGQRGQTLARSPAGRSFTGGVLPCGVHLACADQRHCLYNKAVIYDLLFEIAAETLRTIAADPKHLGAQIGATLVLHTWGSALTHHPHVHGIVPGGGLSLDGERWISCKPGFFLSVRVLSRLFRRRFVEELSKAHAAGQLQFFGEYAHLADASAFADWLAPLKKCEWVVYAKRPFAGPEAVLAYLSRYTHRVAIANSRLITLDERGVTFRWKDYRAKGKTRHKTMTLTTDEFMRRFLLHVLPSGFHRIRHYGLLANGGRRDNLARVRDLLQVAPAVIRNPRVLIRRQSGPADLRLPGLWCCDDHRRNPGTQTVHPRTTPAARRTMNTSAFRDPNHPPMLHRPEPIRERFAWWRKIHVSCPLLRRKIGGICLETVLMDDVIVRQTGLLVRSNG